MAGQPKRRARKLAALQASQQATQSPAEPDRIECETAEAVSPTAYTDALGERICERIALGETLTRICRDPSMPKRATVWRWTRQHEAFAEAYEAARKHAPHAWADDLIEIADDSRNDTQVAPDGTVLTNHDNVQRARLRTENRFRLMAAFNPETYGQRTKVDVTVSEGLARDLDEGRKRALEFAQQGLAEANANADGDDKQTRH